jgi:predicted transcriptional regulator
VIWTSWRSCYETWLLLRDLDAQAAVAEGRAAIKRGDFITGDALSAWADDLRRRLESQP